MRDRVDPLIFERAPWLARPGLHVAAVRALLDWLLGYKRTLELGHVVADMPAEAIMDMMSDMLARHLTVEGLENLPESGPALVVANHPTGIADGIMLWAAFRERRRDMFFYANSDILRVLPQYETMIAPVEWREEKRSRAKTRETMVYTRKAIEAGRLGVIFPSGRLAKRRGLRLHERPWMASAAMIARKYDLPVIPLNIRARNSVIFYLFDLIHPTLRDITLFHEMLNKDRQPYHLRLGRPLSPRALPAGSEEAIEVLREATLELGGKGGRTVSLVDATPRPRLLRALAGRT
ncbi:MAG: glycerol acyltransferase [Alphaproteobacteria bacterium]|nr:MAG: glycerol acyltransferase [Alphaproteobacteria bacterium]